VIFAEVAVADLREEYERFINANPHVYAAFVSLARQAKARGKKRLAIKALLEVVRWELSLKIAGPGEFKLNNSISPYLARAIMTREPDLAGIFEIRRVRSDDGGGSGHDGGDGHAGGPYSTGEIDWSEHGL
jgi:hypothetical protein